MPKTRLWIRVVLFLLVIEKVIQHLAVTVALIFDLGGIRASLALDITGFSWWLEPSKPSYSPAEGGAFSGSNRGPDGSC